MKNSKHISILTQGYFSSNNLWLMLVNNDIQSLTGIDNGFTTCEVSSDDEARVVELIANKLSDRLVCLISNDSHKEAVQARCKYWFDIEEARNQVRNHMVDAISYISYMSQVSRKPSVKITLISKEAIERMDALHDINYGNRIISNAKHIFKELREEGFEKDEIVSYLKHLIDKNV